MHIYKFYQFFIINSTKIDFFPAKSCTKNVFLHDSLRLNRFAQRFLTKTILRHRHNGGGGEAKLLLKIHQPSYLSASPNFSAIICKEKFSKFEKVLTPINRNFGQNSSKDFRSSRSLHQTPAPAPAL